MNPISPLFVLMLYGLAFGTAYVLSRVFKREIVSGRFATIDGLRGLLAFGVYVHHTAVWYTFLQTKNWEKPDNRLYHHLGETSVVFFFMITAFLFISKLLDAQHPMQWKKFFIGRIFRLTPVYLCSVAIMVFIVFWISDWMLKVPLVELAQEIFYWGTFTIIKPGPINGFEQTFLINAGVVWSLPYEWLFYFSLPVLALFLQRNRSSWIAIIVSVLFVIGYLFLKGADVHYLLAFAGGAIAPFVKRFSNKEIKVDAPIYTIILLICFVLLAIYISPESIISLLPIAIIFNLIALGNSVFGLLKTTTLKLMGDISYSTYLLHGMVLFVAMYITFGKSTISSPGDPTFSILILALAPVVIILSFISYRFIEKPGMNKGKSISG